MAEKIKTILLKYDFSEFGGEPHNIYEASFTIPSKFIVKMDYHRSRSGSWHVFYVNGRKYDFDVLGLPYPKQVDWKNTCWKNFEHESAFKKYCETVLECLRENHMLF